MKFLEQFQLYRKWWRTWKTFPVLPWLQAAQAFKKGDFEKAQKFYEVGLEKTSGHPAELCARLDYAFCLFKNGDFSRAEEQLQFAVSHAPNSREAQLRLAHFQIWCGYPLEAVWTLRRALRVIRPDKEIVATLLLASLEGNVPAYVLQEAEELSDKISLETDDMSFSAHKLRAARARLRMLRGEYRPGRGELAALVCQSRTSVEAILLFAEVLIAEDKIAFARQQLRRALLLVPTHPRVLSLLAESYLRPGPFFNPDYAIQLATTACQHTGWMSAREMHILAQSFFAYGDKMAALLMASKAKQAGSKLLGAYPNVKSLDRLIEDLSSGTLA